MKPALALLLYICFLVNLSGQSISGRVVDSNTGEALEYVSIGVLNTRIGTITDEKGEFSLVVTDLSPDSTLRISMIGYASQIYSLREFQWERKIIQMEVKPFQIGEVPDLEGGMK